MKPIQKRSGETEKKPQSAQTVKTGPAVTAAGRGEGKPQMIFDAPSEAVWTRYIDSRMKQFGTR